MATINPSQDYDIIHTLTFSSASGTCTISLYRGSSSAYSGTVYYRAGTSGSWTPLSVSGFSTTFPVSNTTMQVAHDWNKSGNNYMTPSFRDNANLLGIAISQKAVLSGVLGNDFMYNYAFGCSSLTSLAVPDTSNVTSVGTNFMGSYAYNCSSLTSLAVPDTSNVTSVGDYFMYLYAFGCSSLTSLAVPDTSNVTSVGDGFMYYYAFGCSSLTSLDVPDTSNLTSVGSNFMQNYATNCTSLTRLELPAAGWFEANNVNWSVPSTRLGILQGYVKNPTDLADWQALTVSGKTLYTNYIRSAGDVVLATINPGQDYDAIHTLTFSSASGTCRIRLYRGSTSAFTGTVYYRAGTSGSWTTLNVSGTSTTFPVTNTTVQVAHDWNKSGDNYMTPSFQNNANLLGIAISQKAPLSGVLGGYFMYTYTEGCSNLTTLDVPDTSGLTSAGSRFMSFYAYGCSNLTTLAVPDTSNVTIVGNNFMRDYARDCTSLTSLSVPDTSNLTSVGGGFMRDYARDCTSLTSLAIPDTSNLTSAGSSFMSSYAYNCTSLTRLELPKAGWFEANNVDWSVPAARLGILKGYVTNPTDLADWQALTVSGKTLYTNYIRSTGDVVLESSFNPHISRRRLLV